MMALARLDIPGLALYGGSINPGKLGEKSLTIQDVFEAVGAYSAGKINEQEFMDVENFACPGAGACMGSSLPTPCPRLWSSLVSLLWVQQCPSDV